MQFAGFDWDQGNREKCRKHGVSIHEIEGLFSGILMVSPDPAHSQQEARFKAIGVTAKQRHVLIVFTLRRKDDEIVIRPISARYMHQKEVAHYEKETAPRPEHGR